MNLARICLWVAGLTLAKTFARESIINDQSAGHLPLRRAG